MKKLIEASRGIIPADLVLKNGKVVNVFTHQILKKDIAIVGNTIVGVGTYEGIQEVDLQGKYVLPGFIDAHLHIESSMLIPSRLSSILLSRGVTTVINDPHEVCNAMGTEGLDFMLQDGKNSQIDYYFMLPSSVPSCDFEVNGAGQFLANDMKEYINHPKILGLAEVMRYEDILEHASSMNEKLNLFKQAHHVIDGHAPNLKDKDLQAYRLAGVQNDHEAVSVEEAIERLQNGFQLFIREGSGARNLEDLVSGLLKEKIPFNYCSFCTDDKHIEDILEEGTLDYCLKKAVELGCDPIEAIKMATINTANHYHLATKGAIAPSYDADLVIVDDLKDFKIDQVYKNGKRIEQLEKNNSSIPHSLLHSVHLPKLTKEDLLNHLDGHHSIEMIPKQLLTKHHTHSTPIPSPSAEYNLVCAIERYGKTEDFACTYLEGFHLQNGAIASSYGHDSHNVIAAGDNAQDILIALKELEKIQGGYVLVENGKVHTSIPLPIAGIMCDQDPYTLEKQVHEFNQKTKEMGVPEGIDPFLTLSFLSLPVIPEVRITPQGLFDSSSQQFIHTTTIK